MSKITIKEEALWEVTAYSGIIKRVEIGAIHAREVNDYVQIDGFRVKEGFRGKGIGKRLLEKLVEQAKECENYKMIVFPISDPYPGETIIEPKKLYKIYEKMGFKLENQDEDTSRPGQKMIKYL